MSVLTKPPARSPSPSPRLADIPIVHIRHPAYSEATNDLLTFPSTDSYALPTGETVHGVHFTTVHTACAIIADNRYDGWLSRQRHGRDKLELGPEELLEGGVYYFHVMPEAVAVDIERAGGVDDIRLLELRQSHRQNPSLSDNEGPALPAPYRYPIVPNFREWMFPDRVPSHFTAAVQAYEEPALTRRTPIEAVRHRDRYCLLTAAEDGLEFAHLTPAGEKDWFTRNRMATHAINVPRNRAAIDSQYNAILLRRDIHWLYDRSYFTIVPKPRDPRPREDGDWAPTIHVIDIMSDSLAKRYHNQQLRPFRAVRPEYWLARFAWDIFPSVLPFLTQDKSLKLAVWQNVEGEWQRRIGEFSAADCSRMAEDQGPSRSVSRKRRQGGSGPEEAHLSSRLANSFDSGVSGLNAKRRVNAASNSDLSESEHGTASESESDDDLQRELKDMRAAGYSSDEIRIHKDFLRPNATPGHGDPDIPRGRKRHRGH